MMISLSSLTPIQQFAVKKKIINNLLNINEFFGLNSFLLASTFVISMR